MSGFSRLFGRSGRMLRNVPAPLSTRRKPAAASSTSQPANFGAECIELPRSARFARLKACSSAMDPPRTAAARNARPRHISNAPRVVEADRAGRASSASLVARAESNGVPCRDPRTIMKSAPSRTARARFSSRGVKSFSAAITERFGFGDAPRRSDRRPPGATLARC